MKKWDNDTKKIPKTAKTEVTMTKKAKVSYFRPTLLHDHAASRLLKNIGPIGSLLPKIFFLNLLYRLGFQGTHSSTCSAWMSFLHIQTCSCVCTSVTILFSC